MIRSRTCLFFHSCKLQTTPQEPRPTGIRPGTPIL